MRSLTRRAALVIGLFTSLAMVIVRVAAWRDAGEAQPPAVSFPFATPQLAPLPPADVTIPESFPPPPTNALQYFDDYSWRTFVALMWSADAQVRGAPDLAKSVLDDVGPRVWERWKAMYEVFPASAGSVPPDWSVELASNAFCSGAPPERRIAMSGRLAELNQAGMGRANPMGPLVDRHGSYVQYEIRINETAFNHVRALKLYERASVTPSVEPFPHGAIAVKAAWVELRDPSDRARFHCTQALVLDPATRRCVSRTMGLVALHIAHKTPSRPQWIWSTFEHVDALTESGPFVLSASDPPAAAGSLPTTPCTPGAPPVSPLQIVASPVITTTAPANPTPIPLARLVPITACTAWTDGLYRAALTDAARQAGRATPALANYRLVATQWPTTPFSPLNEPNSAFHSNPFPRLGPPQTNATNVTMETYVQKTNSCMKCHAAATADFLWFPDVRSLPVSRRAHDGAIRRLNATNR